MALTAAPVLNRLSLTENEISLAGIETKRVASKQSASKSLRISGTVQLDESRIYNQVCYVPGIIEKMYVNYPGTYIKKGQLIASVYSKELIGVLEAFEYSKQSQSVIRAAKNNLKSYRISEKQLEKFDIKRGNYRLPVDIYSDFNGVVLEKKAREGDHAANSHMGKPTILYTVADMSRLWAVFDVPEYDLATLSIGDKVTLSIQGQDEVTTGKDHIDRANGRCAYTQCQSTRTPYKLFRKTAPGHGSARCSSNWKHSRKNICLHP